MKRERKLSRPETACSVALNHRGDTLAGFQARGRGVSDFEYIVGFYALLLGLAVANVVIGFADMWRERERMEIGWSPPLLAASVLLGAMNTWLATWQTHLAVKVDAWQMIAARGQRG